MSIKLQFLGEKIQKIKIFAGRPRILYRVQNKGENVIFRVLQPMQNLRGCHRDESCTDTKRDKMTKNGFFFTCHGPNTKNYTKSAITF